MVTKSRTILALKIVTSIGALLYFLVIAMTIFYESYPIFKTFGLYEVLLLIFIAGLAMAWANKKLAAGIIFMIWNTIVWLTDLYFDRPEMDYSMMSAMASFFMFIGAFFLLEWYKTSIVPQPSKKQLWKFMLRVLLINYGVLYAIVVFSELSIGESVNYLSYPFIIYPLLLLLFLIGFLLSWKKEFFAGYIFLFWFVILIYVNVVYLEVRTLGGWAMFGLPILLQGIFYLRNHNKFRAKH